MTRNKLCASCNTRAASSSTPEGLFCEPCDEYAGWENQHSDRDHDSLSELPVLDLEPHQLEELGYMKTCLVCHPELIAPVRKGHTNTAAKSYTSHADCGHPRTAKSREICRRSRRIAEKG